MRGGPHVTRERRTRRSFGRSFRAAFSDLPLRLARLVSNRRKGGRRADRRWTRRKRIAVALSALVVLGGAATTVTLLSKSRSPSREMWRLHDEAFAQFHAGRFEETAAACRRILALNAADSVARFNLGAALVRLGRRDEGLREIREAARDHPNFDDAHTALAEDALGCGDEDAALAELRLVTAEPPTRGAAESMLAAILSRRGRDAEAMPHLAAAAADPMEDAAVRVRCGTALGRIHGLRAMVPSVAAKEKRLELECYAAARQVADAAIERAGPADAGDLYAARAELRLAQGGEGAGHQALADAELALEATADPARLAALRLLRAQIYAALGDADAAEKEMTGAISGEAKPSAAAFRAAAALHVSHRRFDRALEFLRKGTELHPADVETGLLRARIEFQTGDLDAAEAECVRLADADRRGAAALVLRGDVRRARDDVPGARAAYAEAVARSPEDVQAKLRLAGTAFEESGVKSDRTAEQLAECERLAGEVLADRPGDAGALLALAKVRLAQSPGRDTKGRPDLVNKEALKLLHDSVEGDPLSIEARTFLAYAQHLTRNDQAAASELGDVLSSLPDERPRLRILLARCLLAGGSYPHAAEAARRAVAALPDDADAWAVRAEAAHAAGDGEGALEAIRRLESLAPHELRHVFAEAALLAEMGRFAAAEERFAAAAATAEAIADEGERAAAESNVAAARAEFYRQRGDVERAKGTLGALLDRNPTSAAPYVRYARLLLKIGQPGDAERQVERGLAVEPGSLDARRMLCEILFARGDPSDVLASQVDYVARIAPKDPLVDYLRGKLSAVRGDLRVARDLLARYVDAVPADADGQYALGVTLGRSGEYAGAVKRLETAGELLPGSPEVRVALAKVRQAWAVEMMRRGRLVEAQATLRRVVSEDPTSREARALLVDSLRAVNDVDLSEKEVRALLQADPADRAALRMLGAIQVQRGRLDDAAATLRRLADAAPDDWTSWQFLSAVLADKGDLDGADAAAATARNAAPDEPGSLAARLHVLVRRGRTEDAEREIAAAAGKHPEEPQYPYFLAMLRAQEGRHEEAVLAAGRALDLRPSMAGALQLAIHALSSGLKDSERAAEFARERVAKARDDAVMTYLAAALAADLGRRDEALSLLGPICAVESPLPPALALRALLVLESGDFAAAREHLRQGIETYADAVDLHYLLAQSWLTDPAHVRDGEPREPARGFAVAELRAVIRVLKSHPAALNNLAWLLSRDEPTRAEALQHAETIVAAHPGHAPYLDTWGTVLLQLGRTDQAIVAFRRALGACEADRGALEKRAAEKLSSVEASKMAAMRRRLDRVTAEVKAHYDEALRASSGR